MFDLSLERIVLLTVVALFVLGPERLPAAAKWLGQAIRTVKSYANETTQQLRSELGPEFEELRRPLEELRAPLRELRDPRRTVMRHLFDDTIPPSSTGPNTVAGGVDGSAASPSSAPDAARPPEPAATPTIDSEAT